MIDMRDAFFERVVALAKADRRIVFLTADHGAFALKEFEREMPERYINVGISEQSMVGVAAGLAASGKIVFVYGIAPFVSLRVLEQLTLDVAAMQLPVNIVSVGAGFTYSTDGPSHQGLQDLSAVLTVPGLRVLNSSDPKNTMSFVDMAISSMRPSYIRIEKEKLASFNVTARGLIEERSGFTIVKTGTSNTVVVGTGALSHEIHSYLLEIETGLGVSVSLIDLHQLKPIPEGFAEVLFQYENIITVEEGYVSGLGMCVAREVNKRQMWGKRVYNVGVEEDYVYTSGSRKLLLQKIKFKEAILHIAKKT